MAARELPCPYRIVDDFGNAFAMGCFAGKYIYN
jgi:mitochondrial import inner membrane translocase subunit TIM17